MMRSGIPSRSLVSCIVVLCSLVAIALFMIFDVLDLDGSDLQKRIFQPSMSSQPTLAELEGAMRHGAFAIRDALGVLQQHCAMLYYFSVSAPPTVRNPRSCGSGESRDQADCRRGRRYTRPGCEVAESGRARVKGLRGGTGMDGRRTRMLIVLAVGLVLTHGGAGAAVAAQSGTGKPLVYNHVLEPGAAMDRLVHQTYDARFHVVDFKDGDHVYIPPRLAAGAPPTAPADTGGKLIEGKVTAFFIIAATGRVADPVIISSSDPRLNPAVLDALAVRVYEPARIDGWNVATTAGEEIAFPPPAR